MLLFQIIAYLSEFICVTNRLTVISGRVFQLFNV